MRRVVLAVVGVLGACTSAFDPARDLPTCGDGVRGALEGCDDGGRQSGDGCSAGCVVEPGWLCGESGCAQLPAPSGATGPTGEVGAPGIAGPTGPIGPTGATGPAGPTGPAGGPPGPAGPAGVQGVAGPEGPRGVTGPTGPAGPTGATGSRGPGGLRVAFFDANGVELRNFYGVNNVSPCLYSSSTSTCLNAQHPIVYVDSSATIWRWDGTTSFGSLVENLSVADLATGDRRYSGQNCTGAEFLFTSADIPGQRMVFAYEGTYWASSAPIRRMTSPVCSQTQLGLCINSSVCETESNLIASTSISTIQQVVPPVFTFAGPIEPRIVIDP